MVLRLHSIDFRKNWSYDPPSLRKLTHLQPNQSASRAPLSNAEFYIVCLVFALARGHRLERENYIDDLYLTHVRREKEEAAVENGDNEPSTSNNATDTAPTERK